MEKTFGGLKNNQEKALALERYAYIFFCIHAR